jgi:hypothetical protein
MSPWEWGITVVVIASAIWIIQRLRSQFREDSDDADRTLEMLSQFRELHQEGGLTDDEFRSIRSRLSRRVQEVTVTATPAKPASTVESVANGKDETADPTPELLPVQQSTSENVEQSNPSAGTRDCKSE